ncbi:MAG: biotin/lipoyl-binding protein [Bacteroidales bacterium]|nr:biotin/lipoyl-binding protein [Bacteroidales bacterium]
MKRLSFIPYCVICIVLASCGPRAAVRSEEYALQEQSAPLQNTKLPDRDDATSHSDIARTVSKGRIESVTDVAVYSQMQEQIVVLNIKDGSIVRKGDVIVELNDENLMNQLVQARNAFEQAEFMYHEILVGQGYSIEEMDKVPEYVLKISKVKSGYNTNEASLSQAERNYAKRNVTAPISGTVTDVSVHQFDLPQSTAPLCRIFDPRNMKLSSTYWRMKGEG